VAIERQAEREAQNSARRCLQDESNKMTNGRKLACFGLAVALLSITFRTVGADSTPEGVLEGFNSAASYEEANQYLTGRMKAQLAGLGKETQERVLKAGRMKRYHAVTSSGEGDRDIVIVTDVEFVDNKQPSLAGASLIYEFVKENNQWKIEWRQSGSDLVELFTQKFSPNQFHSQNSFQFDGKPVRTESAFAIYEKDKRNEKITWIHIRFYPFKFRERDIEFLKYNSGPSVEETDRAMAIASSLKYPVIRLDLRTGLNNRIAALSFGWDDGDKKQSTTLSPPLDAAGIKQFAASKRRLTLILEGSSRSNQGAVNRWNINMIDLPLLKKGL
jgi:hypothetical protein